MNKEKQRNSSIELLRILASCAVVVLHYNNAEMGGGFRNVAEGSVNWYVLSVFQSVFVCAVNVFVMVSGYFLCTSNKRRLSKVFALILQVIVFNEAIYFGGIIFGNQVFSVKLCLGGLLPVNYYVVIYTVLYIISPYFNVVLSRLKKKDFQKLLIICMLIFSIWSYGVDVLEGVTQTTFMGLNPVGAYGSGYGYTIVNFMLVYMIGAYIRMYGINVKTHVLVLAALGSSVIIFVWRMIGLKLNVSAMTGGYNHPFVILLAAVILVLFCRLKIQSRNINELAKAAFTCYIFHCHIIAREELGIKQAVTSGCFTMLLHMIALVVGMYLVSYIIYKIYNLCTGWFVGRISKWIDKIDISVTL